MGAHLPFRNRRTIKELIPFGTNPLLCSRREWRFVLDGRITPMVTYSLNPLEHCSRHPDSSPLTFILLCFSWFYVFCLKCVLQFYFSLPSVHFLIGLTAFSCTHNSTWFLIHNNTQISCYIPLQPPFRSTCFPNNSIKSAFAWWRHNYQNALESAVSWRDTAPFSNKRIPLPGFARSQILLIGVEQYANKCCCSVKVTSEEVCILS